MINELQIYNYNNNNVNVLLNITKRSIIVNIYILYTCKFNQIFTYAFEILASYYY